MYSIKEISQVSGVQPHTIRAWEQRFELFIPLRNDNNVRFYNDEQFKKLLNVCDLMDSGMKISEISELSQDEIRLEIDKILEETFKTETRFTPILNQLIISFATFDEVLFDKIFSNSILRFGLEKTYIEVVYPLLLRIGLMWRKDDLMPVHESFISNLIRQKILASIDSIPIPTQSKDTWILFLGEHEQHEISLLFSNFLLRKYGKKVIYLGSKLPLENLVKVADQVKATHFLTFFVKNHPEDQIQDLIDELSTKFGDSEILLSGNANVMKNIKFHENVILIQEIETLLNIIR